MQDNDTQLQLKKRARRRLVGAVAFAGLAAVVLPMIMDHEPKEVAQEVVIRIPGQDEKPFAPNFATAPVAAAPTSTPSEAPVSPVPTASAQKPTPSPLPVASAGEKATEKATPTTPGKPEKPVDKPPPKPPAKPEKPIDKPADKPVKATDAEAQRAAAILSGKSPESSVSTQHVILIGAFTNPANVTNLQTKLAELGIKVYSEPLDTPQGKKTRVRAGPFASREAGEKALEKMKRIGVAGVLTTKQ